MHAKHLLLALLAITAGSPFVRLAAEESGSLLLKLEEAKFPKKEDTKPERKKFRDGLSGIAFAGDGQVMFLACDETVDEAPSLEQLTRQSADSYGQHQSLLISDFIPLISSEKDEDGRIKEIDMEALAVSDDQYLWLIGSHGGNRKEAKEDKKLKKNLERLALVDEGPNRLFIGRIPLVKNETTGVRLVAVDGKRKAGRLTDASPGWDIFSLLKNEDPLKDDEHFGRFFKRVNGAAKPVLPSKDNGFDIEGMAVVGNRVFLGLRGPVLRGMACILEIRIKDNEDGSLKLDVLNGGFYIKHFVDLGGLGIRDLHLDTDRNNLWILSGPTMALDGPTNLRLWKGAITTMGKEHSVTFGDKENITEMTGQAKRWEAFIDFGTPPSRDHPEGIALFPGPAGQPRKMVILYDGVDENHTDGTATNAKADLLSLP
ncbi:MAG TPA: DUF3616 domain-containing protein [Prosthecobacter sp.]